MNALILSRSSKEYESWSYRRSLVQMIASSESSRQKELEVCMQAADSRVGNYYAWTHRVLILADMTTKEVLREEEAVRKWIWMHVRDSSAWHYRRMVLLRLGRRTAGDELVVEIEKRFGESQSTRNHRKALEAAATS